MLQPCEFVDCFCVDQGIVTMHHYVQDLFSDSVCCSRIFVVKHHIQCMDCSIPNRFRTAKYIELLCIRMIYHLCNSIIIMSNVSFWCIIIFSYLSHLGGGEGGARSDGWMVYYIFCNWYHHGYWSSVSYPTDPVKVQIFSYSSLIINYDEVLG